jgi:hypothetical protein
MVFPDLQGHIVAVRRDYGYATANPTISIQKEPKIGLNSREIIG